MYRPHVSATRLSHFRKCSHTTHQKAARALKLCHVRCVVTTALCPSTAVRVQGYQGAIMQPTNEYRYYTTSTSMHQRTAPPIPVPCVEFFL
eukprot:TRINITY_DN15527_c0_g1_i1.p1 TRINITY_DN15527_c0_g1~~TRINITY_DN15527_c0_g1_i1.p1  ORF type:complete len:104 (+),score=9.14 TRINITY_DN15527_c0_g1_i1:40-312(+)